MCAHVWGLTGSARFQWFDARDERAKLLRIIETAAEERAEALRLAEEKAKEISKIRKAALSGQWWELRSYLSERDMESLCEISPNYLLDD
jgi:hypothetical protein